MTSTQRQPSAQIPTGRHRLSDGELALLLESHERFVAGQGGKRAQLPYVDLSDMDLAGRILTGADLSGSILDGACLSNAQLEGAVLTGCDMRGADLRGANLRHANLRGACLSDANLDGADLTEADLRPGIYGRAQVTRGVTTVVQETRPGDVAGANFSGATLDRARLDGLRAPTANFREIGRAHV